MMVHFFDNTPAEPGEDHGPLGPTHCGSVPVDYEYQAEQWVMDVRDINSSVVRVELHQDDGAVLRKWEYTDNSWRELK